MLNSQVRHWMKYLVPKSTEEQLQGNPTREQPCYIYLKESEDCSMQQQYKLVLEGV